MTLSCFLCNAQTVEWIQIIENDENNWLTTSSSNNFNKLFFGGLYSGSLTFGEQMLNSEGSTDGFISVIDINGNLLRTISWGGTQFDNTNGIEYTDDAIFLVGDSSSPSYELLGNSYQKQNARNDIFLAKIDRDLSEVIWHKNKFSEVGSNFNTSFSVGNDLINIAGFYGGFQTITFDFDGDVLWQKEYSSSNSVRSKIHQDKVYTVIDSFHVDYSNGSPVGGVYKHKLIQYNTTGEAIKEIDVFNFETAQLGYGGGIDRIEIDNNNNIYLVGTFSERIQFDGEIFDPEDEDKGFIAKFDSLLSPLWIRVTNSRTHEVTTFEDNYWITWLDFDEVTNTSEFRFEKYSLDDSLLDSFQFSSIQGNLEFMEGEMFLVGVLNDQIEVDNQVYSNRGFPDFLIMKIETSETSLIAPDPLIESQIHIYPNPVSQKISIESTQTIDGIKLFNSVGKPVLEINNIDLKEYELKLNRIKSGTYYLLINDQKSYKLIITR